VNVRLLGVDWEAEKGPCGGGAIRPLLRVLVGYWVK